MRARWDLRLFLRAKLFRDYMFESILRQVQVYQDRKNAKRLTFSTKKRAHIFSWIFIKLDFAVKIYNFLFTCKKSAFYDYSKL